MVCSGMGAATAVIFTNPLDVIKTRLQMQNELVRSSQATLVYRGPIDCAKQTWKKEGLFGLQRGLSAAVVRDGSKCFFRIGLFEPILAVVHKDKGPAPIWKKFVAGASSGFISAIICNPLDLIKVRIQAAGAASTVHHEVATPQEAVKGILQQEGFTGMWKGTAVNAARAVSFTSVMLAINSTVKESLTSLPDGMLRDITASFIGSLVGIYAINPFDVIRTRIYNQPVDTSGKGVLYNGMIDAATKIAKTEGVLAFWKGALAHYARAGPHTVLTFIFIGKLRRTWREMKERELTSQM